MSRARRIWRPATVLPAVASALIGFGALAVVSSTPTPVRQASFADRGPLAGLDSFYQRPGGMRAVGWDFDPDAPTTALRTYSGVDNKFVNATDSDLPRPDVGTAHPHAGPNHGFDFTIPVPEGVHKVCVAAKNIGAGVDYHFHCLTKTFDYGPFGALNSVSTRPGHIYVKGWAMDSDDLSAAITTTVTIDGVAHTLIANRSRPDIANVRNGAGPNHGFEATYTATQGRHSVCISTRNVGLGTNNSFGCRTITLNDSPRGAVDSAAKSAGKLRVAGWTFDTDAPTTPLNIDLKVDGTVHPVVANLARTDIGAKYPSAGANHGYVQTYALAEGSHTVCVTAHNIGYGANTNFPCRTAVLNFTPAAAITTLTATATGARVSGWASDPDTSAAIAVNISVDGHLTRTMTASGAGSTHAGHNFAAALTLKSGSHNVCVVGVNTVYGTHNSPAACRSITLALKPIGKFESLTRATGSGNLAIKGWALDPDTTSPLSILITIGGKTFTPLTAGAARPDIAALYPAYGANHGIASVVAANEAEHTVCLTAVNVGGGSRLDLGCKLIIAVHPVAPSAPQQVAATSGYGAATVKWVAPASDGGAPWTRYTITASGGGPSVTTGATSTSATITGLKSGGSYTFTVTATNVAGTSLPGTSPLIKLPTTPPPQTTPAPISTSRYIRNISTGSATELAVMRAEGVADAKANPGGHSYMILLDIGGQDQFDNGVVLSATTRFVTYGVLLNAVKSYVDGYHSAQLSTAPVTIAVGTNNDMDVNATTGAAWARNVVNPLVSYASGYAGMKVAGANDIEPGFRASYTATKSWLSGYLAATSAPFVFNGSADGCAWTVINRGCNNGWTMAGLYYLAAGAAPTRMQNLPQIYNMTMADQWKYISLTGVATSHPRINFVGPLTEWTACAQTGSCGSITGNAAWTKMWANLQSDTRLKVPSLPYSTDLRIDR